MNKTATAFMAFGIVALGVGGILFQAKQSSPSGTTSKSSTVFTTQSVRGGERENSIEEASSICGNGIVETGEECDFNDRSHNFICNEDCTISEVLCGNINSTSIYDDQEPPLGDEINSSTLGLCTTLPNFYASPYNFSYNPLTHTRSWSCIGFANTTGLYSSGISLCQTYEEYCGDSIVQSPVEQCDDGNSNNSDLCTNNCENNHPTECEQNSDCPEDKEGKCTVNICNDGECIYNSVCPEKTSCVETPTFAPGYKCLDNE